MQVTNDILKQIAPSISEKALMTFVKLINTYQGEVNTDLRMAAFLAQVLHESGQFRYVHELASGDAYEGRADLGNIYKGDGRHFKGRGLIQITGRDNYGRVSKALFGDDRLLATPDLLATPTNAVRSAYWFWADKKLNDLADTQDMRTITKRINGGYNGWAERKAYYDRAVKAFAAVAEKTEQPTTTEDAPDESKKTENNQS
jgi:putative chitinase